MIHRDMNAGPDAIIVIFFQSAYDGIGAFQQEGGVAQAGKTGILTAFCQATDSDILKGDRGAVGNGYLVVAAKGAGEDIAVPGGGVPGYLAQVNYLGLRHGNRQALVQFSGFKRGRYAGVMIVPGRGMDRQGYLLAADRQHGDIDARGAEGALGRRDRIGPRAGGDGQQGDPVDGRSAGLGGKLADKGLVIQMDGTVGGAGGTVDDQGAGSRGRIEMVADIGHGAVLGQESFRQEVAGAVGQRVGIDKFDPGMVLGIGEMGRDKGRAPIDGIYTGLGHVKAVVGFLIVNGNLLPDFPGSIALSVHRLGSGLFRSKDGREFQVHDVVDRGLVFGAGGQQKTCCQQHDQIQCAFHTHLHFSGLTADSGFKWIVHLIGFVDVTVT